MSGANAASLEALRDIHLPSAVGLWPLAPGWWVLIGLALAIVAGVLLHLRARARRARTWEAESRRELDHLASEYADTGDEQALAKGLSELLRRAALAREAAADVAALHGEAWSAYWAAHSEIGPEASRRTLEELTRIAYGDPTAEAVDPDTWIRFTRQSLGGLAKECTT